MGGSTRGRTRARIKGGGRRGRRGRRRPIGRVASGPDLGLLLQLSEDEVNRDALKLQRVADSLCGFDGSLGEVG
jgi:hypothetical protein